MVAKFLQKSIEKYFFFLSLDKSTTYISRRRGFLCYSKKIALLILAKFFLELEPMFTIVTNSNDFCLKL